MNISKLLQQAAAHLNAGEADTADALLKKILKKQPKNVDALNLAGVAAYELQDYERAQGLLERVVRRDPSRAGAHLNLGAVMNAQHDFAAAERHYRTALRAQPDNAVALNNLGKNCLDQNKLDDAAEWLAAAAAADPGYWIARHNLGTCQRRRGDIDGSIASYRAVLERHPNADTLSELIGSLRRTDRFDEELAAARQLLVLPGAGDAAISAWESLFDACDWDGIERSREHVLGLLEAPGTRAPLREGGLILLHSLAGIDHARTFRCHRAWAQSVPNHLDVTGNRRAGTRINIGYLSPDFRDHSVGLFIRHVIAAHDQERFTVNCYSSNPNGDAVTEFIRQHATTYRDVSALSDAELIRTIVDDGVDILIDLAGHTRDSRVGIMAHRIAPVQVTYLGYPGTTGLANVDFRITDPYADDAKGTQYSETLLEMPESFLCFGAFEEVARANEPPAASAGHVTFGSFNNIRKLNPAVVAAWSAVMHQVAGSRFVIKSRRATETATRDNLLEQFARNGITDDRITLLPPTLTRAEHLEAYNTVDVVLDTFTYNGTTTTCEALWMGVPVITFAGSAHAQRVSYSILTNTALSELVAWTADDYVDCAVRLATEPTRLAALRRDIPARVRDSILCEPVRFTRQFEELLSSAVAHRADGAAAAIA